MEAKLVVVSGTSGRPGEFKLNLPTIIGRSRSVDLPIGHPLVSRQHCELFEDGDSLKIRDLGSLNGTFVGEARITEDTVLEPGALFTVGPLTFKAVYGKMPSATEDENPDSEMLPPQAAGAVGRTVDTGPTPQAVEINDADAAAPEMEAGVDAGANGDGQFDWLGEAPEETPAAGADADFTVAPEAAASSDTTYDSTVEIELEVVPEETPAPAKSAAKAPVAKAPAAKPVAKAAPAKPVKNAKPAAAPAQPAKAPAADAEEDIEFAPPPARHEKEAQGGGDVFDFLE